MLKVVWPSSFDHTLSYDEYLRIEEEREEGWTVDRREEKEVAKLLPFLSLKKA